MMKNKISILFILLFSAVPIFADQSIYIKKTKGQSAIIESEKPLIEGKKYRIVEFDNSATVDIGDPKNSITLGGDISIAKANRLQENYLGIEARYGWIDGDYEYGPTFKFESLDQGGGANTKLFFGGYGDYRLYQDDSHFGLTGQAQYGYFKTNDNIKTYIYNLGAGVFYSWFFHKKTSAFRTEALAESKTIVAYNQKTQALGFNGKIFLVFYY